MNRRILIQEGSRWKRILSFALPIAATSMLQQFFHSTDTAVVGRFAGSKALAAVGSTSSVTALCITVLLGLSAGVNVWIAHGVGLQDLRQIKKGIHTSMLLSVIVGIALTGIGEILIVPLLRVLNTPGDIFKDAVLYLRIYFLGAIFLVFYNVEAAILRGMGDAKRPLYSLIFSGVLNLCFNLLFVMVFHLGVAGVALGTLLADAVNAAVLFWVLKKEADGDILILRMHQADPESMKKILQIGIPATLQEMTFTAANLILQSGFNYLGSDVVAASAVAINAEIFTYYLLSAFGQAALTFNAQDYGAGNLQSCRRVTRGALFLGGVCTICFTAVLLGFSRSFAEIFVSGEEVILLVLARMRIVLVFEVFDLIIEVLSGALRGRGHAILPAAGSVVFICGTRILWIALVFYPNPSFERLVFVYPVSWICDAGYMCICYVYTVIRQKYKNSGTEYHEKS